ncbi:Gfo/Idh/MocA family oxidoreductase [Enterocloster asparagiformis]|uniref:Gfo/Idh/MocA family oxidoreductase n=1 Tax=Enterocloster asparagiformis TaxID=333367 RepID=UPI002355281A|nr:Gfo/Idh/MocA family oxidoreductase [Enterocloster asparagiformis]
MIKDRVNICLIGAGRAGMIHGRNFASRVPGACIISVCDPSEEACAAAAGELGITDTFTDYREALRDERVDAVVVVTPTAYHRDIVIAAAKAGKHILCEKPMAMNAQECEEMIQAAEENHVKLQVGFMRRFDASFVRAKELLDSGAVGDLVLVKSLTRGPSIPKPWMYDIHKSNGPLAEVNSHDIDTMRWFSGSEFQTVYALAGNYRCGDARQDFPDFYDNVILNARFANGVLGCLDGAQGVRYGYDARVEILGTKGSIMLGDLQDKTTVVYTMDGGKTADVVQSWMHLFREAYLNEDISFVKAVREDGPVLVTGRDGLMAVRVVNAGNKSIVTGNVVEL